MVSEHTIRPEDMFKHMNRQRKTGNNEHSKSENSAYHKGLTTTGQV